MDRNVTIDLTEYKRFFAAFNQAARGDFKKELAVWLEGMGYAFLEDLTNLMIARKISLTGNLISSFQAGGAGDGGIWDLSKDQLTLEVGTSVEYAPYVNDGHEKVRPDNKGVFYLPDGRLARFVPGHWIERGDGKREFIYTGNARKKPKSEAPVPERKTPSRKAGKDNDKPREGMVLIAGKVEGSHFWEDALNVFEREWPEYLETKLSSWLAQYFSTGGRR